MALPSTALVRTNVEKSESQSAQSPPLDLLRTTSLPVMRRGPGLTISQLAKAGGTLIESGLNMVLNHRGPAHYETSIKRFFGDDDHDKREAALDELHIALVSGECRSARHKDLRDDCCQLLKYARPK
jgi:hypothetical protein